MTPVVLRSGPYRFYFHSRETGEAPHVHVDRDDHSAKFWLTPVQLSRNLGFAQHELRRLELVILHHQAALLEAWHDFFQRD